MKVLFSTCTQFALLAFIALVICGVVVWTRLPDLLSKALSQKMQVPVSIQNLSASWDQVVIDDIQVNNPSKSTLSHALTCHTLSIDAPLTRYLSKNLVIDKVHLHQIYLGLEFNSALNTEGNWTLIMDHIKKRPIQSADRKTKRTVLIKKLILTDTQVDVVYRKEGGTIQRLPLIPYMEMDNISSEGGFPMNQMMHSILGELLKEIFIKQNLKNVFRTLIEPIAPLKEAQ